MVDKCRECGCHAWGFDWNGKGFCVQCRERGLERHILRDKFAMAALKQFKHGLHRASAEELRFVTKGCYRVADAMLEARNG